MAYVRPADDAAHGITGCKELAISDAIRRRIEHYKRVPVHGEHVKLTDMRPRAEMAADERANAVQKAKAFFSLHPDKKRSTARLELMGFSRSEFPQIATHFNHDSSLGAGEEEAPRKRIRNPDVAKSRRGPTASCNPTFALLLKKPPSGTTAAFVHPYDIVDSSSIIKATGTRDTADVFHPRLFGIVEVLEALMLFSCAAQGHVVKHPFRRRGHSRTIGIIGARSTVDVFHPAPFGVVDVLGTFDIRD